MNKSFIIFGNKKEIALTHDNLVFKEWMCNHKQKQVGFTVMINILTKQTHPFNNYEFFANIFKNFKKNSSQSLK